MSSNFDWNTIPGMQSPDTDTAKNNTDHFDDFFNQQLLNSQNNSNSQVVMPNNSLLPAFGTSSNAVKFPSSGASDTQLTTAFSSMQIGKVSRSHSADTLNAMKTLETGSTKPSQKLHQISENPTHSSSTDTLIADNENSIPLSLTINDMSPKELKTYLRWYENIQDRKSSTKIVTIDDVFLFLQNFKIPEAVKERMRSSFAKWASSLNIGQFFALMRLLAHALHGKALTRSLIRIPAPIPNPMPILSRKRKQGSNDSMNVTVKEEDPDAPKKKLDIDSFTEFLLTGERPSLEPKISKNSNKKVKFSEVLSFSSSPVMNEPAQPSAASITNPSQQHVLDFSLPMDQLLDKLRAVEPSGNHDNNSNNEQLQIPQQPTVPELTENEEEELKDINIDTFKNITQRASQNNTGDDLQALKPDLTGSASKSMKEHFMQQFEQTFNFNNQSNTFNDISSLAANTLSPPVEANNFDGKIQNLFNAATTTTGQHAPFYSQQQPQQPQQQQLPAPPAPPPLPSTQSEIEYSELTAATSDATKDYFGFIPHQQSMYSLANNKNNGNNNILQPPPPPPRSRAASSTSPPPVPPRSRKMLSPSPVPLPSANNANPALPPKPALNDKQKKQYLSVSDEIGDNTNSGLNNYNQYHINNTSKMSNIGMQNMQNMQNMNMNMNINNMTNMNGLNNVNQINQLNHLTQMSNMGNNNLGLQNLQNYNGTFPSSGMYGQQSGISQYRNQGFMNQQTGGGWPSQPQNQQNQRNQEPQQHQQHQQQQQQQNHPMQGQSINWAGWNV